jgi:Ca2+-binding EF-hand superfamily protein
MGNVLDCASSDRDDAPREKTEFDSLFRYELDTERKTLSPEGIKKMLDLAKHPEKRLEEEKKMFLKFDNACKETLEDIFERYDIDRSGTLNSEECKSLMSRYIKAFKIWYPYIMKVTIDRQIYEAVGQLPEAYRKEVSEAVLTKSLNHLSEIVDDRLPGDDNMAKEIFVSIDQDGDGNVDKDEFSTHFNNSIRALLNPETIKKEIEQKIESFCEEALIEMSNKLF